MPSIRWIRNVHIDGQPSTIEVMVGVERIGDRSYVRIDREPEQWFHALADTREAIVIQGKQILQGRLQGHELRNADGTPFNWD